MANAKTISQSQQIRFQAVIYGFVDVPADIPEDEVEAYVSEEAIPAGFWNESRILVGDEPLTMTDDLTNDIMEYVRKVEGLNPDSDLDDIVYGRWHELVRSYIQPR